MNQLILAGQDQPFAALRSGVGNGPPDQRRGDALPPVGRQRIDAEDHLNVYANYIVPARQVDDTLDIMICRSVGANEAAVYKLSEAEKEIVLEKMDEYCQEREGMTLDEYCDAMQRECLTPEL